MNIGYACLALGVPHSDYRTIRLDNYSEEKLKELINYNLESLNRIIDYNIDNEIRLFRISSDLIPFGSNSINCFKWWDVYKLEFERIGRKIKENNIRVSMHPGQYTVLNSPKEEVVYRSIQDLIYHARVLDSLEVDSTSKIVLHIGGIYGDKEVAISRFITNFQKLPQSVKKRLITENDERCYNIEDVLKISSHINIPVVFDNLHHLINLPKRSLTDSQWIELCSKTWKEIDGKQKVHYSQQDPIKKTGSHSFTINYEIFKNWYSTLENKDIDIMLEVKDKNISAIKISNCISNHLKVEKLEKEWEKYKYKILEHSTTIYEKIKKIIKSKTNLDALKFYKLIDEALNKEKSFSQQIDAILHIWEYFKDFESEQNQFLIKLVKVNKATVSIDSMKRYLYKLAIKYENKNLVSSYFFAF